MVNPTIVVVVACVAIASFIGTIFAYIYMRGNKQTSSSLPTSGSAEIIKDLNKNVKASVSGEILDLDATHEIKDVQPSTEIKRRLQTKIIDSNRAAAFLVEGDRDSDIKRAQLASIDTSVNEDPFYQMNFDEINEFVSKQSKMREESQVFSKDVEQIMEEPEQLSVDLIGNIFDEGS